MPIDRHLRAWQADGGVLGVTFSLYKTVAGVPNSQVEHSPALSVNKSNSRVRKSGTAPGGQGVARVLLLNKPFGVLCQFTAEAGRRTLKDYVAVPGVYAAGRLDADSEGLVLLTDDGALQHRIADPRHKLAKTYLAQVEGAIDEPALATLRAGLDLGDFRTLPCVARAIAEPDWLWQRDPPVRFRKSVPTSWVEIVLREGKNRQVRRMTAKIGHPTLRLIRVAIGPWRLDGLEVGAWRALAREEVATMMATGSRVAARERQLRR